MAPSRTADLCKRRMSLASRRLGTTDPVPLIGGIIDRSFNLPVGDPRYGRNALLPGSLPLEHSFSEAASHALRFDMEPLGPDASPWSRRWASVTAPPSTTGSGCPSSFPADSS